MNKAIISDNKVLYTTPEIEITLLDGSDVITVSGPADGFWGEEHDLEGTLNTYEW